MAGRPVYSKSLYAGTPSGVFISVYFVPDGFTTVVRDITLFNQESTFYSSFTGPQLTGANFIPIFGLSPWEVVAQKYFHWEGRHVLPPGGELGIGTPTAELGLWNWTISGYELAL